jgi:hypothetical protein
MSSILASRKSSISFPDPHHTIMFPNAIHTPASPRHSPPIHKCFKVLFLSNADASAVAPSAPMSFPDACVAHITIHNITRQTQHTLQHPRHTHISHPDAAGCCSSPTPMQAPSRTRHQCRWLMHASPHTSRNTTTRSSRAQSPIHTPHTLHTTHTPASHRHSPSTCRCCSALFLSNADASAAAPSSPMPLADACVATHHGKQLYGPLVHNHIATYPQHHTPHTAHTPASRRHSLPTSRCCSVLFLSNADASAVAPSSPMPFTDACVATHVTKHNTPSSPLVGHASSHAEATTLTIDSQTPKRAIPL